MYVYGLGFSMYTYQKVFLGVIDILQFVMVRQIILMLRAHRGPPSDRVRACLFRSFFAMIKELLLLLLLRLLGPHTLAMPWATQLTVKFILFPLRLREVCMCLSAQARARS